jgi:hypothetical protein
MTIDMRHKCPCCGIRTWVRDYRAFMLEHDRPDGRKCRAAARLHRETRLNQQQMCAAELARLDLIIWKR